MTKTIVSIIRTAIGATSLPTINAIIFKTESKALILDSGQRALSVLRIWAHLPESMPAPLDNKQHQLLILLSHTKLVAAKKTDVHLPYQ